MTIYAVVAEAGDVDSYDVPFSTTMMSSTSGNKRAGVRASFAVRSNRGIRKKLRNGTPSEFWFRWVFRGQANMLTNLPYITFYELGVPLFRISTGATSGDTLKLERYDSGAWSTLVTSVILSPSTFNNLYVYDLHIKLGNPGICTLYATLASNDAPAKIIDETALNLAFPGVIGVDEFYVTGVYNTSTDHWVSEMIMTDWCTLGAELRVTTPNANGTYLEFTAGDYLSIDEPVLDTVYALSGTADQRLSYSKTAVAALMAGGNIESVFIGSTANYDAAGGPTKLNHFWRISSIDYHSADAVLATALAGVQTQYDLSPATGLPWTLTELNAAQAGFRSRA